MTRSLRAIRTAGYEQDGQYLAQTALAYVRRASLSGLSGRLFNQVMNEFSRSQNAVTDVVVVSAARTGMVVAATLDTKVY